MLRRHSTGVVLIHRDRKWVTEKPLGAFSLQSPGKMGNHAFHGYQLCHAPNHHHCIPISNTFLFLWVWQQMHRAFLTHMHTVVLLVHICCAIHAAYSMIQYQRCCWCRQMPTPVQTGSRGMPSLSSPKRPVSLAITALTGSPGAKDTEHTFRQNNVWSRFKHKKTGKWVVRTDNILAI